MLRPTTRSQWEIVAAIADTTRHPDHCHRCSGRGHHEDERPCVTCDGTGEAWRTSTAA